MKILNYFFALIILLSIASSCTTNDTEEDLLSVTTKDISATGEDGDVSPDDEKDGAGN